MTKDEAKRIIEQSPFIASATLEAYKRGGMKEAIKAYRFPYSASEMPNARKGVESVIKAYRVLGMIK